MREMEYSVGEDRQYEEKEGGDWGCLNNKRDGIFLGHANLKTA